MTSSNKAIFGFIRVALGVLILIIVLYAAKQLAYVGYDFGYRIFTEKAISSGEGREVPVLVQENMSDREVAQMLAQKGLIRDENLFFLQLKLFDYSGKMVPGVYTLNTNMSPKELMQVMSTVVEAEESTQTVGE